MARLKIAATTYSRAITELAASGGVCTLVSMNRQPTSRSIDESSGPLGKAPTANASTTYEMVKKNLSSGVRKGGPSSCTSIAIAAMSSALSASDEKNCAAMIV